MEHITSCTQHDLLADAATALCDQLPDGLSASQVRGAAKALRSIVQYLRENGVDDEGAWDHYATHGLEVRRPPRFKPFRLVIEALGQLEDPEWAEVTVDIGLIETLLHLRRVSSECGLESASVARQPDAWDLELERRIINGGLFFHSGAFWFIGHPKYGAAVETRAIDMDDLMGYIENGERECFHAESNVVFYGSDPMETAECYFGAQEIILVKHLERSRVAQQEQFA